MNAPVSPPSAVRRCKIAILGSGFSGLGMAIRLKQQGEQDFLLFEKEAGVGGTWRVNNYPGCGCDVQSHLYSFSFEPNPNWTRMFARQPEIKAYLEGCWEKYCLQDKTLLGTEVVQSSGNPQLDHRAEAIARSSGPFEPFSPAMRAKADQLAVVSRF